MAQILKGGSHIKAVAGALINSGTEINVFSLDGSAGLVQLDNTALCAKSNKQRQISEVVDMVINGLDA